MRAIAVLATFLLCLLPIQARADFSEGASQLTRAPYLSDLTGSSVQVNWATTTQSRQTVKYGTGANCTASGATSASGGSSTLQRSTTNGQRG